MRRGPWFLVVLLASLVVLATAACKPRAQGLGEGPPEVDADTQVLASFKPAQLADPGAGSLDFDAVAGDPELPPQVPELPPPTLEEFGPIGDTGEYANIEFRFNRPVAALGDRERLDPKALGLVIEPKLDGELYFAEPTRLVFAPTEALPLAHVWQVRLDARLQAVDGPTFAAKAEFSFATTPPSVSLRVSEDDQVKSEYGADIDADEYHWDAKVLLDAADELTLGQLKRHVRAEVIDRRGLAEPVAITLRKTKKDRDGWAESDFEITPKTHWPAGREVVIRVDEGLVGRLGPRPMGVEEVMSFAVTAGVRVISVGCYAGDFGDGCDLGPLLIEFSAPVTRAQAKRVSVSPTSKGFDTLAYERESWWEDTPRNSYWSILAWGDYHDGGHYTVTVDPKLRDVHGQILVGESEFAVDFVEPPPELRVANGNGTLVDSNTPRAGIESRHAEQLRLRVAVLDDETHERMIDNHIRGASWPSEGAVFFDERIVPVHQGQFGWAATEVDFHRFTGSKPAAVLFEASVTKLLPRAANRSLPAPERGLVQISDLGVSVVGSLTDSWVRVADVTSDKPVIDAQVELIDEPGGARRVLGETDSSGLLALPGAAKLPERALLRVRKGDDKLLVSIAKLHRGDAKPEALRVGETTKVAVTTERALYKPGEVVRAIGWATVAGPYQLAGVRPLPAKAKISFELRDYRNEVVAERTVTPKRRGKFWATLPIPATAALGNYTVIATVLDGTATAKIEVKDFVAPEFEVSAEAARADLHHGETTTADVNARYYFGGPVPIVRTRTSLDCQESDFRPPGLAPEWRVSPGYHRWRSHGAQTSYVSLTATAKHGHVETIIEPRALDPNYPAYCTLSVALADQTQREVGAETSAWFHPNFYLTASVPTSVTHASDLDIPIATLDFDGSRLPVSSVEVTLERRWYEKEWVTEDGKRVYAGLRERKKKLPACKTDTLAGDASCRFPALQHGRYTATIVAVDASAPSYRPTMTAGIYVPEPRKSGWTWSSTPRSELSIEVDKPKPNPGDTIRARVTAPWASGAGVVLITKGAIHEVHRFDLNQGIADFTFVATDAWIPATELWAVMIEPGDTHRHPRLATAHTQVSLDNHTRNLNVAVDVPREAHAGDSLPIVVHARDTDNQPIRGHVSVWAVDEAVLALAPHELPNFVDAFTVHLAGGLEFVDAYASLIFAYIARADTYRRMVFVDGWAADPDAALGTRGYGSGYGSGSGSGFGGRGKRSPSVRQAHAQVAPPARSKFESAPIFIGDAELDAHGVAHLSGELPDNLTTFRVTALVSSPIPDAKVEARFGTSDARVRVTQPIVVRAALPRILRPGDSAEVGVLVDNLRAGAGKVEIEVTLDDPEHTLELLSPATATLAIAAGGQVRVPFKVRATKTGAPRFTARATVRPDHGPDQLDAVQLELPVEPERTMSDRVAVYGTLDAARPVLLPFELPADADPAFGGLTVSIGSSMLGGVEDAVAYLVGYPHGCVEQTSSSLLPLIPLGALAKTYPLGIADTDTYVEAGVARLRSMQLSDGGFGYWPGAQTASPYGSAYATWVLGRAQAAGYRVPDAMLEQARVYLRGQVDSWSGEVGPPHGRDIEIALALATLAESQHAPSEALTKLHERRTKLPMFARATLLMAIHSQDPDDPRAAAMLKELRSFVDEREASARIETDTTWTWYWDSNVRSSAMMLSAMLALDPQHTLVPKLARGLLDARRGGRWSNTQENAYALIALAEYARIYEAQEPNFEGRVWLDRTAVARVRVQGRSFAFEEGFTGMPALLEADKADPDASRLLLERAGTGRMYYRVGLEWASTATNVRARSEGLRIERSLRDESGPIAGDRPIAAGILLAMDVVIHTRSELTHVAIELPLPAGLEAIDMGLGKGTAAMRIAGSVGWFVSHQELRRDRAVVFADRLPPGEHTHTVWLRATTPGDYVMPPASAQMMYYPEVYGRTASSRVSVD